jgi:hypothetical protein
MSLLTRKTAILAKAESVYSTDPVPTGAANAILISGEPNVSPMDMKVVDRNILRAYFGNSEKLPTGIFSKVDFSCEIAGAGTAGTVPAWGVLLRACAFAETISAGVSVAYAPVTDNLESATIYFNRNGVLHKLTGARGSVKLNFTVDGIPKFDFSFTGLFNAVVDVAMPTLTLTAWKTPLPCNHTNTPTFTIHGYAAKMQALDIDVAADISAFALLNDTEHVEIVDRKPAGKIVMEATTVAAKDWWTTVKNITTGTLNLVHGTTAGNIVQIDAPKVQIFNPTYSNFQGVAMLNGDLVLAPNAGNDELVITAK